VFVREIGVPVTRLKGVGPATAAQLARLEVRTVGELLTLWPRDWDDRTREQSFSAFNAFPKITVRAKVSAHDWFGFGRMRTLKLVLQDSEGVLAELPCFNRPFLERQFPVGSAVVVHGSFHWKYGSIQASAFEIEPEEEAESKVLPVYPLTAGLAQNLLRKLVLRALSEYGKGIDTELPEKVRRERQIPPKAEVLRMMHAPESLEEADKARKALVFEEFWLFELAIGKRSLERRGKLPGQGDGTASSGPGFTPTPLQSALLQRLPFALTEDQKSALGDIGGDFDSNIPMARLLQGDVGSGKTLVAFMAALRAVEGGGQAALLAPTELLARQHAENSSRLLEPLGVRLAFLTGNLKAAGRSKLLAELAEGKIDIVIGTHALFSKGVRYKNLRFAMIDEQHRFGVLQRSAIIEKGTEGDPQRRPPHLLMMSATPIPRTLALSVFGDLDVSVIRTMPPGRKPIITHLTRHGNEGNLYGFVGRELAAGRQAYFVYPLIEESETLSLKSAAAMFEHLKTRVFPGYPCALIHSQVEEEEQRRIMAEFRSGAVSILVATSVVEVGVDVPNATCMVIEHAERFGLAALHQLRGRVGRGSLQSYCFLVYAANLTEDAKARLKVMHETTDGFVIAEEDLKIRGPGDIAGIRQSGYLAFDLADPLRDREILEDARNSAFTYLLEELS